MAENSILMPVAALVLWTMLVLLLIPYQRFRAVFADELKVSDFKNGESERVLPRVAIPNRCYMNLLEAPTLFYLACLTAFVSANQGALLLGLAWAYVLLRILQSLVHLSYNNVLHRLGFFACSNIVLVLIWLLLSCALVWPDTVKM